MLGASKAISSTIAIQTYGVFITPDSLFERPPQGAGTTSLATANVTGAIGSLTYLWARESGGGEISINSPTDSQTTFSVSSKFGNEFETVFKVTVTDAGNGNAETSSTINVHFLFDEG